MLRFQSFGRTTNLSEGDATSIAGHVFKPNIGSDYLLYMLRPQVVLGSARMELGVGVDEENLAAAVLGLIRVGRLAGKVGPHHEDTSRDACAVEKIGWQTDDGL